MRAGYFQPNKPNTVSERTEVDYTELRDVKNVYKNLKAVQNPGWNEREENSEK